MARLNIFLGIFGLFSLAWIIHGYGYAKLGADLALIGWQIIPLFFSFVPTLLCYCIIWYLCTDLPPSYKGDTKKCLIFFAKLFRINITAIAWNNLSPFIKFLGEPIRTVLLRRELQDTRRAVESVVIFNLLNMAGTLASFVIAALSIPLLFPIPPSFRAVLWLAASSSVLTLALLLTLPVLGKKSLRRSKLRRLSLWVSWSSRKLLLFYSQRKLAFATALFFGILARFVEGLTFYIAFRILGVAIPIVSAAYLDVGRALADNLFFFVPYQLASRELAVGFLLEKVFLVGGSVYISATLFYRLVEILWMITGYGLGLMLKVNPAKETAATPQSP